MKSLKYEHTHEEWEAEGTKRISKKKKNLHKPKSNPTHKKTHLFSILFSVHGEVNAFKWNLILVSPILCHGCCFFYFEWKNKIVKLALLVIAKKRKHKNSKTAKEERERERVGCRLLSKPGLTHSTVQINRAPEFTQHFDTGMRKEWTCFNSSVGIEV